MEVSKSQGLPGNYPKAGTCMAVLPSPLSHREHKLLPQNAQSWGPFQSSLSKLRLTSHWSQTPKSSPVFPSPEGGREKEHGEQKNIISTAINYSARCCPQSLVFSPRKEQGIRKHQCLATFSFSENRF